MEAPIGYTFGAYERIPVRSSTNHALDPTYDFLSRLGKVAGSMISSYVNARALSLASVKHVTVKDSSSTENGLQSPALLIQLPSLIPRNSSRQWRPWAKEILRVRCHSISLISGQATFVAEAKLLNPLPQAELIKDRVEDDIIFQPQTGIFAFKVTTAIGESMVEKLRERLIRIERLMSFLAIIGKDNLTCENISLNRIIFLYSSEHNYNADINFAGDSSMTLTLARGNPHLRVKDFLTRLLNDDGLENLIFALRITLPLMQVFDELERATPPPPPPNENAAPDREFFILPRATTWYQIRYTRPQCTLDIRLRPRRDQLKWFIQENVGAAGLAMTAGGNNINRQNTGDDGSTSAGGEIRHIRTAELAEALKALMNDSGDGWIGLRTGIAADPDGVVDVLRRVDDIMRRHAGDRTLAAGAAGSAA